VFGYDAANVTDNPGIPPLSLEPVRFDAATGDLAITETDPFVRCAGTGAYPPSEDACRSFVPASVQLRRTTEYTQESSVVRVIDRWSSTDGGAHRLDLTLSRLDCITVYGLACTGTEYRFPGEAAFAPHAAGSVREVPAREPILVRGAGTTTRGGVAVIPAQAADGAQIRGSQPSPHLTLEYGRTIPAQGELVLVHYYVYDADSDHLAQAAADVAATIPVPRASTPAAAPAPAPAPAAKAALPTLSSRGRVRVRRAGRTFLVRTRDLVGCPAGGATCVLAVHGTRVKASDVTIAAGATARVSLRLNRRGVRALTRERRLRFAATLSARAGTGPQVTQQRRFTIRLR
jgi:hypothetical protein